MNRILRLAIAAVVLGALSGVLYWSNHHAHTAQATPAAASPVILNVHPESVTALTIADKGEPPISLARETNGQWQITAPDRMAAGSDQVSYLLQSLSPLNAQEVVSSGSADLKAYGLDDPSITIDIAEKGHPAQRLLIGDNTPIGGSSYAMLAGEPRVFTTAMDVKQQFNTSLSSLRDKRLITMSTGQMTRIEVDRNGSDLVLAQSGGRWQLEKPAPYRTDSFAAGELASTLAGAQMEPTQPAEKVAAADFANGTPVATVKVTGSAGTQTLDVREGNTSDYVKSSVVPGVYQVDLTLGDSLTKTVDDFRNKQVFDFGDNQPDSLTLRIAGAQGAATDLSLTSNLQGWWMNGKKVSSDKAQALVSSLRALTATKFATSGFSTPVITAAVASSNGTETVEIAKSGSHYLARRTGDPSLYVLDGGAVEGVESAAAAIKPAAAAK